MTYISMGISIPVGSCTPILYLDWFSKTIISLLIFLPFLVVDSTTSHKKFFKKISNWKTIFFFKRPIHCWSIGGGSLWSMPYILSLFLIKEKWNVKFLEFFLFFCDLLPIFLVGSSWSPILMDWKLMFLSRIEIQYMLDNYKLRTKN